MMVFWLEDQYDNASATTGAISWPSGSTLSRSTRTSSTTSTASRASAYTTPGGHPTVTNNRKTIYTYTPLDQPQTIKTLLGQAGGGISERVTEYDYGATVGGVIFNHFLALIEYPSNDQGEHGVSSAYKDSFEYNALGEITDRNERSGTHYKLRYDAAGRVVSEKVTSFPAITVDGQLLMNTRVDEHQFAYDALGRGTLFTSLSGGVPQGQVKREYDGLGSLKAEYQEHSGTVTASSKKVSYAYTSLDSGHHLSSIFYPSGREIEYNHFDPLDALTGRPTSISDSTGAHEEYSYAGLNTIVGRERDLGATTLTLSYARQPGDADGYEDGQTIYSGFDRFGRIIDQGWKLQSGGYLDRHQYAYDAGGNLLSSHDLVKPHRSDLYHADGAGADEAYTPLGQMTAYQRGTFTAFEADHRPSHIGDPEAWEQSWGGDGDGHWVRTISNPVRNPSDRLIFQGVVAKEEVEQRLPPGTIDGPRPPKALSVVYDAWGNLALFRRWRVDWLAEYGNSGLLGYSKTATLESQRDFAYDALGRRIYDEGAALYYDAAGNVIEEFVEGRLNEQYVWAPDGVLVLRDRDTDGNSSTTYTGLPAGMDERLWALQDGSASVTAVLSSTGQVVERYVYTPEGEATITGPLADGSDSRTTSAFDWRYTFHGGRSDDDGLIYLPSGQEWDSLAGAAIGEDPTAYLRDKQAYSLWVVRNSSVELHGAWLYATMATRFIGVTALSFASGGLVGALAARGLGTLGASAAVTAMGSGFAGGAAGSFTGYSLGQVTSGQPLSWREAGGQTLLGGLSGGFLGGAFYGASVFLRDAAVSGRVMANWFRGGGTPQFAAIQGSTAGIGSLAGASVAAVGGSASGLLGGWGANALFSLRNPWHEDLLASGALSETTPYRAGMTQRPQHHIFPEEYREMFLKRGVDIDEFAVNLEHWEHEAIHGGGNWRLGRAAWDGEWNTLLLARLKEATRNARGRLTSDEIVRVGGKMLKDYGIDRPFVRYEGGW